MALSSIFTITLSSAPLKNGLNVYVCLDCIKQPTQLGLYEFAVTVCNPRPSFH